MYYENESIFRIGKFHSEEKKAVDKAVDTKKAVDKVNKVKTTVKREPAKKSRNKWEKAYGKKWPKDPENPQKNQDVSHKKALVEPMRLKILNQNPIKST